LLCRGSLELTQLFGGAARVKAAVGASRALVKNRLCQRSVPKPGGPRANGPENGRSQCLCQRHRKNGVSWGTGLARRAAIRFVLAGTLDKQPAGEHQARQGWRNDEHRVGHVHPDQPPGHGSRTGSVDGDVRRSWFCSKTDPRPAVFFFYFFRSEGPGVRATSMIRAGGRRRTPSHCSAGPEQAEAARKRKIAGASAQNPVPASRPGRGPAPAPGARARLFVVVQAWPCQ